MNQKNNSRWLISLLFAGMLMAVLPMFSPLQAGSLVVNDLGDAGDGVCNATHCTLREAIDAANNNSGPDTITFSVTGTISITTDLPALTDNGTVVDASGVFGTGSLGADAPGIEVRGPQSPGSIGFLIDGANEVRVSGLFITGFDVGVALRSGASNNIIGTNADADADAEERNVISGMNGDDNCTSLASYAIEISGGASQNTVSGNYIGTDVTGMLTFNKTNQHGVYIEHASDNIIGGDTGPMRNVISGNGCNGVHIEGGSAVNNTVAGNYIGIDKTGAGSLGNGKDNVGSAAQAGVAINEAPDNIIRGNVISGNRNNGIYINGPSQSAVGNVVQGNFIGTNSTGTKSIENGRFGISVHADETVIGGTTADKRNIISGNFAHGIFINSANSVTVIGNYIGTNVNSQGRLGNGENGILLFNAGHMIGGLNEAERNIISANGKYGIEIYGPATNDNVVQGNYIGTNVDGTRDLGNDEGGILIQHDAHNNTIGGLEPGAGNLISGNGSDSFDEGHGVSLEVRAKDNKVFGNKIGVKANGLEPRPNLGHGIRIENSNGNVIGGADAGAGNTIAFNEGNGVTIQSGISNTIRANAIYQNEGLGLDLGGDGVTPNDPDDSDTGPNTLQNFPTLIAVVSSETSTTITGTLHSQANTTFTLDFYSNPVCDATGYGEGRTFLASHEATTDANGDTSFTLLLAPVIPDNHFAVTTTATNGNNTSEFAQCVSVDNGISPPLPGTTYVKVIDEQGQVVKGAQVAWNGQIITDDADQSKMTDLLGNILLEGFGTQPGDSLVALTSVYTHPTVRAGHNGWAYRTYLTSLAVDAQGNTEAFTIDQLGQEQRLTVRPDSSLTLFNLVLSIEWDATAAYLQDVELALKQAADFLYDATDGQMTFGPVAIYDNAEYWADADIQISTKNVVRPHAYIGGITDEDKAHVIRVGRFWDGNSGNQGAWSEANGFKTLVHEFGHYGLGLYDEYFGYNIIDGQLAGQLEAFCTGPENRTDSSDGSIMDYHYTTSELADASRWSEWCQQTAQHQLNGEADWQTLLRLYSDQTGQNRWHLITPDQRAGVGQSVPGPEAISAALPFPLITIDNQGQDPTPVQLTVCHEGTPYQEGAWVTLYYGGKAMDQGLTDDANGQLQLLGAQAGDELRVISLDGLLVGSAPVATEVKIDLQSLGLSNQTNGASPYLRMWPLSSGASLEGVRLTVSETLPEDTLTYALTGADNIGPSNSIPYDAAEDHHQVQINFVPAALAGHAKVLGAHAGQFIDINVDYRLQHTTNLSDTNLFSNDGNLRLHLDPGSLGLDEVHFLIASPWGLPGPPSAGLEIVGEAYEVTASSSVTTLAKPAVLSLRYDPEAGTFENLAIYRWDFGSNIWQSLGGTFDAEQETVSISTSEVGLYALMGSPLAQSAAQADLSDAATVCQTSSEVKVYLPLVMKN